MLLLHGLASTRRFWDLVLPGLAGLPVVALDQRGHGDSDRPAGPYDGATVAADALTALDALGISRAVVVGHSWGASTALRLAADAPERVLAVVAVDGGLSSARDFGGSREAARERLTPPRTALPPEQLQQLLSSGPLAPWWSPDVAAPVLALFAVGADGLARARLPFEAHMAIVDDLLDNDPAELLPRITCPAWLVGCGDRSAALARAAALLALPRVQHWPDALHDVPLQWPALVAGLVRAAADEAAGPFGVTSVGSREGSRM
ncbi:MAG: alpha/beta fold hydrolase [Mycobacteriales bacterium]